MNLADQPAIDPLTLSPETFAEQLDRLLRIDRPRYQRLWAYYRNELRPLHTSHLADSDRPYRQAQEYGLPPRITGVHVPTQPGTGEIDLRSRKEVVIENDIAWRIDTMVDYLFGRPITLDSTADDPDQREQITTLLRAVFEANGGMQFLQQVALLGSVYGYVDVLVKYQPEKTEERIQKSESRSRGKKEGIQKTEGEKSKEGIQKTETRIVDNPTPITPDHLSPPASRRPAPAPESAGASHASPASNTAAHPASCAPRPESPANPEARPPSPDASPSSSADCLQRIARSIRFEIVEPARALPLLDPLDCRQVNLHAQVYDLRRPAGSSAPRHRRPSLWKRITGQSSRDQQVNDANTMQIIDILTPTHWARFEDGELRAGGNHPLGRIPLVHIQNIPLPFEYTGASDVEPLIPLQDELNTRLSDRANRITLQSFRMYLGKGIEDFTTQTIAPGRMWKTDNPEADIISFGGDVAAPSEDAHIADIREALDKTSGVTPVAAGAIKNRIGNLTSAAALRITLIALLAKNDRKRAIYGQAIERLCELSLAWLDVMGDYSTTPDQRRIQLHWPSPLPENMQEKLAEAEAKTRLGLDREIVLRELGYEMPDAVSDKPNPKSQTRNPKPE